MGLFIALLSVGALLFSTPVLAAEATLDTAATAWVMTSTALVLFMNIPGLALFYGGLVRAKNVLSLLMHCFALTAIISLLWLIYGYSFAFGDGGAWQPLLGGGSKLFMFGITGDTLRGAIPEVVFSMFQLTFAIITPALVVGGFAERVKFSGVLLFSALWFTVVYIPICHWVWGDGWLAKMGFMDFAGGSVVHINAGIASLATALYLGKRYGFPTTLMLPHNLTMTFTGAAMLWMGWFGFNGGSALTANGAAGMAILVSHMGAAGGSISWMAMEWYRHGKPSLLGIVTGMVAGLGTITPASGFAGPAGGFAIGLLAGFVCYWATQIVKRTYHIDDSLDVFPVHGVGGIMGTMLTAVVASSALGGVGYPPGVTMLDQLLVQGVGTVATMVWCAVFTYLCIKVTDRLTGFRVELEYEINGLDISLHDERGYNIDYSAR